MEKLRLYLDNSVFGGVYDGEFKRSPKEVIYD
jgi:hypothetical protein